MTIFHIAARSSWDAAVTAGEYRVSTLDQSLEEVGFIHASFADQIPATAERFYRPAAQAGVRLCVLVIDEDAVRATGSVVREEEAGNGERFPHIYGPLATGCVTEVREADFGPDGEFHY